jgi:hypothetical protein
MSQEHASNGAQSRRVEKHAGGSSAPSLDAKKWRRRRVNKASSEGPLDPPKIVSALHRQRDLL